MKKYEQYKNSGFEWIGKIPNHWNVNKFKNLYKYGMGNTILKEQLSDDLDKIPVYSATEKGDIFGYIPKANLILKPGDFVIPARGTIGSVFEVTEESTCTQTTIYAKNFNKIINNRFAYYFMVGNRENLFYYDKTAIPQITVSQVSNNPVVMPPLNEQTLIASYLDQKTSQIDSVIEKKKELIEKLKEYRQSLITEVVTKGLDPNVKMKDSGVEWIGEVPEGWKTTKTSYVCDKIAVGFVGSIEEYYTEEKLGIPLLVTGNIKNNKLNLVNLKYVTKDFHTKNKKSQLISGDIIVARHGKSGQAAIIPDSLETSNCLNVAIVRVSKKLDNNYLQYVFNSEGCQKYFERLQGGAVQGVINTSDIINLNIPFPTKKEQEKIVTYLNGKIRKIDMQIKKLSMGVEILNNYSQSIITEVVTGKVKIEESDIK